MLSSCLSFCPQDPTDGSEAWGGGPMPWNDLEGPEIERAADIAEQEGRLDEAQQLRAINGRVAAAIELFSEISQKIEDGLSSAE